MNKYIFIQARMSSTRLPGKVLLPFKGSTVLEFLYDKCKDLEGIEKVVILTSDMPDDDAIEHTCHVNSIPVFRGSLFNVLGRFQEAAKVFCNPSDVVIRLCADSPLIEKSLLQNFSDDITPKHHFFSTRYLQNGAFVSTTGKGNNIDALKVNELEKLSGDSDLEREHIIYGFEYGSKFRLYDSNRKFNENECIDTPEDYERLL